MLELGVSMNLFPDLLYKQLGLCKLKSTEVTLQLVDQSVKKLKSVVENVLIKVRKFLFPVDYCLGTQFITNPRIQILVIFGRPFPATTKML